MKEGLTEIYWTKLKEADKDIGKLLLQYYNELLDQSFSLDNLKRMNQLVKLYSKENVFLSITDLATIENLRYESIFNLVSYMCKERMLKDKKVAPTKIDVTPIEKKLEKARARKKKLVIGDPFTE